jgi:hypothetical protein
MTAPVVSCGLLPPLEATRFCWARDGKAPSSVVASRTAVSEFIFIIFPLDDCVDVNFFAF